MDFAGWLLPRSYTHFCKNCSEQIDSPGHTYKESFLQLVIGTLSGVSKHWPYPSRRKLCLEYGDSKLCAGYISGMKRGRGEASRVGIESIGFQSASKWGFLSTGLRQEPGWAPSSLFFMLSFISPLICWESCDKVREMAHWSGARHTTEFGLAMVITFCWHVGHVA